MGTQGKFYWEQGYVISLPLSLFPLPVPFPAPAGRPSLGIMTGTSLAGCWAATTNGINYHILLDMEASL